MKNWKVIVIGILGLSLGAFLNYIVNNISNKKLLDELRAELASYQAQNAAGRITTETQKRITELQAQINILTNK